MAARTRPRDPYRASIGENIVLGLAVAILASIAVVSVTVTVGSRMDGVNPDLPTDPFAQISGLLFGTLVWSPAASATLIAATIAVLVGATLFLADAVHGPEGPVQRAPASPPPGYPERCCVPRGLDVASLEDATAVVAGPRMGKSTSLLLPAGTAATGTTSKPG